MTAPDPSTREFGFVVEREREWNDEGTERVAKSGDNWVVRLPHQCGPWSIAGDDWDGASHEEAVTAMERFIAEAQAALVALRERREIGGDQW